MCRRTPLAAASTLSWGCPRTALIEGWHTNAWLGSLMDKPHRGQNSSIASAWCTPVTKRNKRRKAGLGKRVSDEKPFAVSHALEPLHVMLFNLARSTSDAVRKCASYEFFSIACMMSFWVPFAMAASLRSCP